MYEFAYIIFKNFII